MEADCKLGCWQSLSQLGRKAPREEKMQLALDEFEDQNENINEKRRKEEVTMVPRIYTSHTSAALSLMELKL